jgi:LysR family transcriptional regulator, nitrogen assimilation regulatory protein
MADTLLRMRMFVAVYEERSFTAAASRESATQSGVTQHIRKLENQFGLPLFLRGTTSVTPTPAGDRYYQSCIEVLRAHYESRNSLNSLQSGLSGRMSIGLTPTMTRCALAPALNQFITLHPNVIVHVVDAYGDLIVEKLRRGELDVAVVPAFTHEPGIRSTMFAKTPQFLVSARGSNLRLRHRKRVKLGQAGPLKMILPSAAQVRRSHLDAYLASTGANLVQRLEIDSSLAAYDFVVRTDWCSIHAGIAMMHEYDGDQFSVSPLADPPLILDLFQIERARHPMAPEVAAFMAVLQKETLKLQERALRLVGVK